MLMNSAMLDSSAMEVLTDLNPWTLQRVRDARQEDTVKPVEQRLLHAPKVLSESTWELIEQKIVHHVGPATIVTRKEDKEHPLYVQPEITVRLQRMNQHLSHSMVTTLHWDLLVHSSAPEDTTVRSVVLQSAVLAMLVYFATELVCLV